MHDDSTAPAVPSARRPVETAPDRPAWQARLAAWLEHPWAVPVAIFAFALALRLCHLQQLRAHDPFFELPSVDPRFYRQWALEIARGDLLGEGVFLQGPLYPYVLAAVHRIFGPSYWIPRFLQCLLGAATCVLTWAVAREYFDRSVAAVAGFMAAGYGMLIFYEGSFLITNLLVPLCLCILLALERAAKEASLSSWFGVGLLVGLSTLARPNMLLYAAFVVGWIPWRMSRTGAAGAAASALSAARTRGPLVLAFLLGFGLCVGVSTARNYAVSGDVVLVSASGGMNFFNGNNPSANGLHRVPAFMDRTVADDPREQNVVYKQLAERAVGRRLAASEVSDFWWARGWEWVRAEPGAWAGLSMRKAAYFWNAFEPWNNRSIALSRQFSWVLRLPLLGLGVVLPLALLGAWLTRARWRELLPLYALVAVTFATCVIFFVLSRYRMPIVPVLLMGAAAAVVAGVREWRDGQRRRVAGMVAVAVLLGVVVNWPLVQDDLSMAYYNLGNKYLALGRHSEAIAQYRESLAIDGSYISAHNNLAIALEGAGGDPAVVRAAWQRVLELGEARGLARYVEIATRHLAALDGAQ